MTQWKNSCQWCLIAVLAVQFSGCAQTSRLVGRWTGRGQDDKQVAELDGRDDVKKAEKSKEKVKIASSDDAVKKPKKSAAAKDKSIAAKPKSKKPTEDQVAAKPKTKKPADEQVAAKPKAKKPADDRVAKASKPDRSPQDTFVEDEETPTAKRRSRPSAAEEFASLDDFPKRKSRTVTADPEDADSKITMASQKTALTDEEESVPDDVREVSHVERKAAVEPDWARDADAEESDENSADTPVRRKIPETNDSESTIAADEVAAPEESITNPSAKQKATQSSYLVLCPDAQGDVRELVRGLDEDQLEHVRKSIHRLGRLGPDAAAAIPALRQLLTHQDGAVRIHAALAICRIDGLSPAVLATLTKELKSDDPSQRSFAAAVIAELGPQSVEALPALASALKDSDAYVRLHVAEVLIRHDEWSETALQTLLACLDEKDENVRWLATYSLAELAPQSEDAVDALAEMLDDGSAKVRIGAVYALGEIGQIAQPVALDLRKLDHDPNPELRSAVAYALEQIEAPIDTRAQ